MRFLIVDDEFVSLARTTVLLSRYGECNGATNGRQAVSMFSKAIEEGCPYSLVTIDVNMPDINGLDLIRLLCKREQVMRIVPARKFLITVESNLEGLASTQKECDAFIAKPLTKEGLDEKLLKTGLLRHT